MVQVEMTNTQPPNVLKKPIGTKRIIATATTTTTSSTPSTLVIDSKRMKYDDNKIAERVPIEELRQGLYKLPEWAEGLFDITPEGQPRRRRRLTHLTNEEKVLRRKLKNRVAAQNARDKKRDESERIKIENEQLQAVVAQMQSDAGNRESEIERLRRENAQLRSRLGLSPPPEEAIILIQSQSNDKFDDSGIHSPLSETHSGSPPDASKDPSDDMTSEMSPCSELVSDDDLISDWIEEATRVGCGAGHVVVQSSPIDAGRNNKAVIDDFNLFDYEFVDEQTMMTNELHPYSNDDLESFLL